MTFLNTQSSNLSTKVQYGALGLSCTDSFVGQKYKAFITSDSENQILAFYRQAASTKPNFEYEFQGVDTKDIEEGHANPRNISGQQIICFMEKRYRNGTAANVLVILDSGNQQLSKKISEIFPNAPSNMRIILIIQGTIPRI